MIYRISEAMMMRTFVPGALAFSLLAACDGEADRHDEKAAIRAAPPAGSLEWSVAGPWRDASDQAIDIWRRPVEVLEFAGIAPGDQVLEIGPMGGYWTAILAPYLHHGGGSLTLAMEPQQQGVGRTADEFAQMFEPKSLFGKVIAAEFSDRTQKPGDVDHVLMFDDLGWAMGRDLADQLFADAYQALAPGGRLVVIQARGAGDSPQDILARSGYVREDFVRQLARDAGFELVEASDLLANSDDSRDHEAGILSLPPLAPDPENTIGAPDRMLLLFRKPRAPAP
jgi:predicted methyltransferase